MHSGLVVLGGGEWCTGGIFIILEFSKWKFGEIIESLLITDVIYALFV